MEPSLPYEVTPDQASAIADIKADEVEQAKVTVRT